MFERLKNENAEGVVFKRHDSAYKAGRPASGGCQLKFKFVATLSAIVAKKNDKRSVALELLDGKKRVGVGNVTIPPGVGVPSAGPIIEIRYLYCFPKGALFQPCYLGRRDDVDESACDIGQLKYKAEGSDEDDA